MNMEGNDFRSAFIVGGDDDDDEFMSCDEGDEEDLPKFSATFEDIFGTERIGKSASAVPCLDVVHREESSYAKDNFKVGNNAATLVNTSDYSDLPLTRLPHGEAGHVGTEFSRMSSHETQVSLDWSQMRSYDRTCKSCDGGKLWSLDEEEESDDDDDYEFFDSRSSNSRIQSIDEGHFSMYEAPQRHDKKRSPEKEFGGRFLQYQNSEQNIKDSNIAEVDHVQKSDITEIGQVNSDITQIDHVKNSNVKDDQDMNSDITEFVYVKNSFITEVDHITTSDITEVDNVKNSDATVENDIKDTGQITNSDITEVDQATHFEKTAEILYSPEEQKDHYILRVTQPGCECKTFQNDLTAKTETPVCSSVAEFSEVQQTDSLSLETLNLQLISREQGLHSSTAFEPVLEKSEVRDSSPTSFLSANMNSFTTSSLSSSSECLHPETGVPVGLSAGVPVGLSAGVPVDLSARVPVDLSARVPVDLSARVPVDLSADLSAGVPIDLSAGVPVDLLADLSTGVPVDLLADLSTGVPVDLSADLSAGVPVDLSARVPVDLSARVPVDFSTGVPVGLSTGVPVGLSTGPKADNKNSRQLSDLSQAALRLICPESSVVTGERLTDVMSSDTTNGHACHLQSSSVQSPDKESSSLKTASGMLESASSESLSVVTVERLTNVMSSDTRKEHADHLQSSVQSPDKASGMLKSASSESLSVARKVRPDIAMEMSDVNLQDSNLAMVPLITDVPISGSDLRNKENWSQTVTTKEEHVELPVPKNEEKINCSSSSPPSLLKPLHKTLKEFPHVIDSSKPEYISSSHILRISSSSGTLQEPVLQTIDSPASVNDAFPRDCEKKKRNENQYDQSPDVKPQVELTCDTAVRQTAGDTAARQTAGDTAVRQTMTGDTAARQTTDDTPARQMTGGTAVRQTMTGDTAVRQTMTGDTAARQMTDDTPARQMTGGTAVRQTMTGDTVVRKTMTGDTAVRKTMTGDTAVRKTMTGDTAVRQTMTGDTEVRQTVIAKPQVELPSDTAARQTMTGDTAVRKTVTDNTAARQTITGDKAVRQTMTGDTAVRKTMTGDTAVRKTMTGDTAVRKTMTGDTAVRKTMTGDTAVRKTMTGDTAVRKTMTGDTAVIKTMTGDTAARQVTGDTAARQMTGDTAVRQTMTGDTEVRQTVIAKPQVELPSDTAARQTMTGDTAVRKTVTGNTAARQTMTGDTAVRQTMTGDTAVRQTMTGNTATRHTMTGCIARQTTGDTAARQTMTGDTEVRQTVIAKPQVELPSDTAARQTMRGDTAVIKTMTGNTAARQTMTGDTAVRQTVTGDTTARQTMTGDTAARQTMTGNTAARQTTTGDTAARQTTGDTAVRQTVTSDKAARQTMTGDTAVRQTTGDTAARQMTGDTAVRQTMAGDTATRHITTGDTTRQTTGDTARQTTGDTAAIQTMTGDTAARQTMTGDTEVRQTVIAKPQVELPSDTAARQTMTGDTAVRKTVTDNTATRQTMTGDAAVRQTVTGNTTARQTMIGDTAARQTMTGDTAARQTTGDTAVRQTVTSDKAARQTMTGDTAVRQTMTGDTAARQTTGDTAARQMTGDTAVKKTTGDTAARKMTCDTAATQMTGDTAVRQTMAGDTATRHTTTGDTTRQTTGDTARQTTGDTAAIQTMTGDTEAIQTMTGDTAARQTTGGTEAIQTMTDDTAAIQTMTNDTAARQTMTGDTAARQTMTGDTAARQTMTGDTAPRQTMTGDTAARQTMTGDTEVRQTVIAKPQVELSSDTAARQTMTGDTAVRKTMTGNTAARQTMTGDTAARQTMTGDTAARQTTGDTAVRQTVTSDKAARQTMTGDTAVRQTMTGDTAVRQTTGDTAARQMTGDTAVRKTTGDTAARKMTGDTAATQMTGDTAVRQTMAGDTATRHTTTGDTARQTTGDTEAIQTMTGDTAARQMTGDTEAIQTMTDDTAAIQTMTNDTATRQTMTGDTAARQTMTGDTAARQTMTGDTAPRQTMTGDTAARQTMTGDTEVRQTVIAKPQVELSSDTAARQTMTGDTAVRKTMTGNTAARQTMTGDTSARQTMTGDTAARQTMTGDTAVRQTMTGDTAARQTMTGDTAARQTMTGDTAARQTMTGDTAARQTVTGDTAARQTMTGDTAARQTMTGDTAPRQTMTGDTAARQTMTGDTEVRQTVIAKPQVGLPSDTAARQTTGDTAVRQTVTGDTTARQTMTGDTAARQTMTGDTAARQTTGDTAVRQTVTSDKAARQTMTGDTAVRQTMTGDTAARQTMTVDTAARLTMTGDTAARLTMTGDTAIRQTIGDTAARQTMTAKPQVELPCDTMTANQVELPCDTMSANQVELPCDAAVRQTMTAKPQVELPCDTMSANQVELPCDAAVRQTMTAKPQVELPCDTMTANQVELPCDTMTTNQVELPCDTMTTNQVELPCDTMSANQVELPCDAAVRQTMTAKPQVELPCDTMTANQVELPCDTMSAKPQVELPCDTMIAKPQIELSCDRAARQTMTAKPYVEHPCDTMSAKPQVELPCDTAARQTVTVSIAPQCNTELITSPSLLDTVLHQVSTSTNEILPPGLSQHQQPHVLSQNPNTNIISIVSNVDGIVSGQHENTNSSDEILPPGLSQHPHVVSQSPYTNIISMVSNVDGNVDDQHKNTNTSERLLHEIYSDYLDAENEDDNISEDSLGEVCDNTASVEPACGDAASTASTDTDLSDSLEEDSEENFLDAGKIGLTCLEEKPKQIDRHQAKLRASLSWLLSKVYGSSIPKELQDPFYETAEGQLVLRPVMVNLMSSSEIYCQACSNMFPETHTQWQGHWSIIQVLSRKGIYISEVQESSVTETVLVQTAPFRLKAHVALIDALMKAYIYEVASVEKVVKAVRQITTFPASSELPATPEEAVVFWVNKVCTVLGSEGVSKGRTEEVIDGATGQKVKAPPHEPVQVPLLEDLMRDIGDGCSVAAVIAYYRPQLLHIKDLCLKEGIGLADALHNLQRIGHFCQSYFPCRCFHLSLEDLLYTHDVMKVNIIAFLADLFHGFEGPDAFQNEDSRLGSAKCSAEKVDGLPAAGKKSSQTVPATLPISQVTKRSFHRPGLDETASNLGMGRSAVTSPVLHQPLLSKRISGRHCIPQDEGGMSLSAPTKRSSSRRAQSLSTAQDRDLVHKSVLAWQDDQRLQHRSDVGRDASNPHCKLSVNVSLDSAFNRNSNANSNLSLDFSSLGSPCQDYMELESVAADQPSFTRPYQQTDRLSNRIPTAAVTDHKLEPLMPALLKPAKEKQMTFSKAEESGDKSPRKKKMSPFEQPAASTATSLLTQRSTALSPASPGGRSQSPYHKIQPQSPRGKPYEAFVVGPDSQANAALEAKAKQGITGHTSQPVLQRVTDISPAGSYTVQDRASTIQAARAAGIPVVSDSVDLAMIADRSREGSIASSGEYSDHESQKIHQEYKVRESGVITTSDAKLAEVNINNNKPAMLISDHLSSVSPKLDSDDIAALSKLSSKTTTNFAELKRLKDKLGYNFDKMDRSALIYMQSGSHGGPFDKMSGIDLKSAFVNKQGQSQQHSNGDSNKTGGTEQDLVMSSSADMTDNAALEVSEANPGSLELQQLRLKLEQKRKDIERKKHRQEAQHSKMRQQLGKAAFMRVVSKHGDGTVEGDSPEQVDTARSDQSVNSSQIQLQARLGQPAQKSPASGSPRHQLPAHLNTIQAALGQNSVIPADVSAQRFTDWRTQSQSSRGGGGGGDVSGLPGSVNQFISKDQKQLLQARAGALGGSYSSSAYSPVNPEASRNKAFSRVGMQQTIDNVRNKWFKSDSDLISTGRGDEDADGDSFRLHDDDLLAGARPRSMQEDIHNTPPRSHSQSPLQGMSQSVPTPYADSLVPVSTRNAGSPPISDLEYTVYDSSLTKLNSSLTELQGEIMRLSLQHEQFKAAQSPVGGLSQRVSDGSVVGLSPAQSRPIHGIPQQVPFMQGVVARSNGPSSSNQQQPPPEINVATSLAGRDSFRPGVSDISPQARSAHEGEPAPAQPRQDASDTDDVMNLSNDGFFVSFGETQTPKRLKPKLLEPRARGVSPAPNAGQAAAQTPLTKTFSNEGVSNDVAANLASQTIVATMNTQKDDELSDESSSSPKVGFIIKDEFAATTEATSEDEMQKKKIKLIEMQRKRKEGQEKKRLEKEAETARKLEEKQMKEEEQERKKAEEKARRELIFQQYLQKKQEEDDSPVKPHPKRRDASASKQRPKSMFIKSKAMTPEPGAVAPDSGSSSQEDLTIRGTLSGRSTPSVMSALRSTFHFRLPQPGNMRKAVSCNTLQGATNGAPGTSTYRRPPSPDLNRLKQQRQRGSSQESGSETGSGSNPGSDYAGPKLFVKPSAKSNRHIIVNALSHCCLAGSVNTDMKNKVLEELAKCDANHFLILFRDAGCQYRGLFILYPETEEAFKVLGVGPKHIANAMCEKFYKYNSGAKSFSEITSTKHLSVSVDAVVLHTAVWKSGKAVIKR